MNFADTTDFTQLFLHDTPLLDVRAPVEFAQGAFPTATNVPLLNDDERHQVGLRYKQQGQNAAIKLGQQLVSGDIRKSRIEKWLNFVTANASSYLYCFRGGLRSQIAQQWLAEHGVECPLIPGGYKAMRRFLIDQLDQNVASVDFIIIGGRTGSGKTLLLKKLSHHIDLEELARHRGSSFGGLIEPQPSNIDFENALSVELLRHSSKNRELVYIEDESRMIGRVSLPESLRQRMLKLPSVILETPLDERIDISLNTYIVDLLELYKARLNVAMAFEEFADHHKISLCRIRKRFGSANVSQTLEVFEQAFSVHRSTGDVTGYRPYISKLLTEYYDPMYDYQIRTKERPVVFRGTAAEIVQWSNSSESINLVKYF